MRAFFWIFLAPFIIVFLRLAIVVLMVFFAIGGELLGADLCYWLLGHGPRGTDMSALFPALGLGLGGLIGAGVCLGLLLQVVLPSVIRYLYDIGAEVVVRTVKKFDDVNFDFDDR